MINSRIIFEEKISQWSSFGDNWCQTVLSLFKLSPHVNCTGAVDSRQQESKARERLRLAPAAVAKQIDGSC